MPRYRLLIEYDGTPFIGWQIQSAGTSVQGTLAHALSKLTGEVADVRGAGRTDSGVHATGQVAHVDLPRAYPEYVVREAINYHVRPMPVSVLDCSIVPDTFDARFSAVGRHYLYRLVNRRGPPVLDKNRVWWVAKPLDIAAMIDAAPVLEGRHDFTTFRAAGCQAKSPIKTLDRFEVEQAGEELRIHVSARSFMHKQVRSMVGSLKLVGDGRWTKTDLKAALDARDRTLCGPVAPPFGLYLTKVDYPEIATANPAKPAGDGDDDAN